MKSSKNIVFLCGARDFHAMDWYRSACEQLPKEQLCILTDLIAGEGFKKIISEKDNVYFLVILDKLLFKRKIAPKIIMKATLNFIKNPARLLRELVFFTNCIYR